MKSSLGDHKIKKGKVVSPFNYNLPQMKLVSWKNERFLEYMWLCLLHNHYGRDDAFKIIYNVYREFKKFDIFPGRPKWSVLLEESNERKHIAFKILTKYIEADVLAPLTLIYRAEQYPIFNEYFYNIHFMIGDRINAIIDVMSKYQFKDSKDTTDIKYMITLNMIVNDKIRFTSGAPVAAEAFREYPKTEHTDEKMELYRPAIRSIEEMDLEEQNTGFLDYTKKEISQITECNPVILKYENQLLKKNMFDDLKMVSDYLNTKREISFEVDHKFDVVIGLLIYSIKVFGEIQTSDNSIGILGRNGMRILIEAYVMLKYLIKKEKDNYSIWNAYKEYGLGKYKMILLKKREFESTISHYNEFVIDQIVNEEKSEEFQDIDLTYFDKLGIREKCLEVDEKLLYDLYYDYNSQFGHGLWGALRESCFVICDNPSHGYHAIPDVTYEQFLPDVNIDSGKVILLIMKLVNDIYTLPDWYIETYGDEMNAVTL